MGIHSVEKKQLSATAMLQKVRSVFKKVPEPPRNPRGVKVQISLTDCLMSGLAVFGLKFPSLLQFVINYLALLAYWRMLRVLMEKELLVKFSISDLIIHLSYIRKVRINGCWHLAEITDKTRKLLSRLDCHIT